jgi:hypothetical protein
VFTFRRAPARSDQGWRLTQVARAFLVVTATVGSAAVSAQTEAGSEVARPESVDGVAPADAVSPSPPMDQPAEQGSPPSLPPGEPAPATQPLAGSTPSPDHDKTSPVAAVPATSEIPPGTIPTAVAAPVAASTRGSVGTREAARSATTLTVVNGRAITATSVAVLVGAKVVRRSGPLASRTRVTLNLPGSIGCHVSVVASFAWGYSSLRSGKVNVCKVGHSIVRL